MPATFSINIGTITESTRKDSIFSVLNEIPNNSQKLISPRDVRDAFLSAWDNTPFKITTPNDLSGIEYIGLDSVNPNNRDIKKPILLGNRSIGGIDVFNSSLFNATRGDLFIFNTKPDSSTASNTTKMVIMAGTNSLLHPISPYIEAVAGTASVDLNIVNPSSDGVVNLYSEYSTISINDVLFPSVAETTASASDGMILRYRGDFPDGQLKWEHPTTTVNNIGTPGYPTYIWGSTVSVNGTPIEFIANEYVPQTIGGVTQGTNFPPNSFYNQFTGTNQHWPLSEVLRKLLYPYVPPKLELSAINTTTGNTFAEIGRTASVVLTWKLTTYQRNSNERIREWNIVPNTSYVGLTFSGLPGSFIGGTISTPTYSASGITASWVMSASDNALNTFSHSATASIKFVYPIYYGFTTSLITDVPATFVASAPSLKKLIEPYPSSGGSFELNIQGNGYLYFIHPLDNNWENSSLPSHLQGLQMILDPNDLIVHNAQSPVYSAFTSSIIQYNIGAGYPAYFRMYRTTYQCSYPGPHGLTATGDFKFIF